MAFTIDYEQSAQYPMAVTALANVIPHQPVRLADLAPPLLEHEVGLLECRRLVEISGRGKHRLLNLTPRGVRVRGLHEPTLDRTADAWPDRYGDRLVRDLYDDLESLDRDRAGDVPSHVLVTFPGPFAFRDVSLLNTRAGGSVPH